MKKSFFDKNTPPDVNGDQLVADFMNVQTNLATSEVAAAEAQASEVNVTNTLQYATAASGNLLLQPTDIPAVAAESLVKDSMDAHLKKVQAAQISHFTAAQIAELQQADAIKYKGRHIRVAKLNNNKDTFIPLWADNHTGQLREGTYNGTSVTGVIDDLALQNNVIAVRPGLAARTLVPGRKYFLVYIIDFNTWTPNVKIEIS